MKSPAESHRDQIAYWNGTGGMHWVEEQARTDVVLAPVLEALLARAGVAPGEAVLDIGCGCGASTAELAMRVGPAGRVLGLDVSEPMLARARERSRGLANVEYLCRDAAAHEFPAPFADLMVSRFGVMFFGDPLSAFANLRRALKPTGRIVFACWRPIDENPWMRVPLQAAYAHVPRLPPAAPEDPGPFSFADPERVSRILTAAGFTAPRLTPVDLTVDIAAGRGLEDAVHQALSIGATSRALQDQPASLRALVAGAIRAALAPHVSGSSVPLGAAIWLVECRPA